MIKEFDVVCLGGGVAGEVTGLGGFTHLACYHGQIVSPRAREILGELLLAIKLRTPLEVLADVIHPFPAFNRVLGESLGELAAKVAPQAVALF